jgi:hypothetical protein
MSSLLVLLGACSYPDLLQNLSQSLVRLLGLGLDGIEFLRNLRNRPIGLGITCVDVAAGGDVVVVFIKNGVFDDAAEFLLLHPPEEGVGDAVNAFLRDEVLGVAFFESLAGINQEHLTLA